ncbi:MAG: hypothetical protein KGI90_05945 [Burkholderiales bacterium]|nr:hypothetical protein [Burkholderiales bacterium]MDE2275933.1 hypothetical protein [Burkholderiales bacterium]
MFLAQIDFEGRDALAPALVLDPVLVDEVCDAAPRRVRCIAWPKAAACAGSMRYSSVSITGAAPRATSCTGSGALRVTAGGQRGHRPGGGRPVRAAARGRQGA